MATETHGQQHDGAALQTIRDTVDTAVGRVFGQPVHEGGITVLPVASVSTGGGGGSGSAPASKATGKGATGNDVTSKDDSTSRDATGEGGGFGLRAKPAGAFVIRDGTVAWHPALDLNRVILGGQIVAVVALLVIRSIIKARSR